MARDTVRFEVFVLPEGTWQKWASGGRNFEWVEQLQVYLHMLVFMVCLSLMLLFLKDKGLLPLSGVTRLFRTGALA